LTYAEFGFVKGNKEVLGVLRSVAEVAKQIEIVGRVARVEVEQAVRKVNGEKIKQT
jgi:delta8-fatty-acid desaturase